MSDPNAPPLDEERIIEVLDRHQVRYVLVGGMGARFYGATRQTLDFDLCPAWDRGNLDRLAAALRELGARLRVHDAPPDLTLPAVDAQLLAGMELGTWRTEAGDMDVLVGIPADKSWSLSRFEALRERATARHIAGCTIYVAHLGDIIASKQVTNRPPDLAALEELEALQADTQPESQPGGRASGSAPPRPERTPKPPTAGSPTPPILPPSPQPPETGFSR